MSKKLRKQILAPFSGEEKKAIEHALAFADRAHAGQTRRSGEDYVNHPLNVAATLAHLGLDYETVIAGLLHDVLEDTVTSKPTLEKEFGETVAFLVSSVTTLKDVDFIAPKEESTATKQLAENFRKMVLATAKDVRVVLIKLADVLHNAKTLDALPKERRERYAREILDIYAPLAARLGIGELKGDLEDLAFPYVHPKEYNELARRVAHVVEENKAYIEHLKSHVKKLLEKSGISPVSVDARTKHLYSLWQKLERYDNDLSKIYDLVALRIIVRTVPECYEVLGELHKEWRPLPGRIKDYIATPKPSGYRSLHTTVFAKEGKITEFQVRTEEMHYEAEFGIAAHWAYKNEDEPFKKDIGWIQQLSDWQKALGSEEFLESLQIDFFKDRIFVFTPEGDVINLPEEATPVDFAYAIHSDLGDTCTLAKVNGKAAKLSTPLKNNDIVEIVTQKNKKPSRDWLTFVKTSKARSKIRDALREEK